MKSIPDEFVLFANPLADGKPPMAKTASEGETPSNERARDLRWHLFFLAVIGIWYAAVYYGTKQLVVWVLS